MEATPVQSRGTIAGVGEFGLIEIIQSVVSMAAAADPQVVLGIGDDAAAFRPSQGCLCLATCDIQVEGRHFVRSRISALELGRRAAAINLSDIAAMGGRPRHALVSLALPPQTEIAWVRDLYTGLCQEMRPFGAGVIGGNLSGSANGIMIDIALLGEVPEERLVRRRGARKGDVILATGAFGMSAAGLLALERGLDPGRQHVRGAISRHLTPVPRVWEGMAVGETGLATAMIDVSDGLAADLRHICQASGVGARLHAAKVPVAREAESIARDLDLPPLSLALHGGEDYELVFTCPRDAMPALAAAVQDRTGTPVTEIGEITEGPGLALRQPDGREDALAPLGWDHFAPRARP